MDRIEPDETPAEAWKASLDATCNRLMTHYLGLLRAGTSSDPSASTGGGAGVPSAVVGGGGAGAGGASTNQVGTDPRAGGGLMREIDDPPPPLAADVQMSALQAKLAAENLCVASSNALDLIRTLRLSVLLMDEELIRAEEEEEALALCEAGMDAEGECAELEGRLAELRNDELTR